MKINNLKESIEFLQSLSNEMNTQDTDDNTSPRFWVVAKHKREWGY